MRSAIDGEIGRVFLAGLGIAAQRRMSRDYTKLRVFELADQLVIEIYASTRRLPNEERYGLTSQLRRAAVSVAVNIVEGTAQRSDKGYLNYLSTALGSACEVRYLLRLCDRLGFLETTACDGLAARYTSVIKQMEALMARVAVTARTRYPAAPPPRDAP